MAPEPERRLLGRISYFIILFQVPQLWFFLYIARRQVSFSYVWVSWGRAPSAWAHMRRRWGHRYFDLFVSSHHIAHILPVGNNSHHRSSVFVLLWLTGGVDVDCWLLAVERASKKWGLRLLVVHYCTTVLLHYCTTRGPSLVRCLAANFTAFLPPSTPNIPHSVPKNITRYVLGGPHSRFFR